MKNKFHYLFLLITGLISSYRLTLAKDPGILPGILPDPSIRYQLSMPAPQTHYFEVVMTLTNVAGPTNLEKKRVYRPQNARMDAGVVPDFGNTPKNVEGFSANRR